jgi:hypothetical protein
MINRNGEEMSDAWGRTIHGAANRFNQEVSGSEFVDDLVISLAQDGKSVGKYTRKYSFKPLVCIYIPHSMEDSPLIFVH